MSVVSTILFFCFIGTLGARQADIDINRIRLLPKDTYRNPHLNNHIRRSVIPSRHFRSNDHDSHSSGHAKLRAPMHILLDTPTDSETKTLKVYKPREDPRLYYQSDIYLKEINGKNVNNEVSSIYPGTDVVRPGESHRKLPVRLKQRDVHYDDYSSCMRCPPDRTLIAKPDSDRVMLQRPHILTCAGLKAPRGVRFIHMYGPVFGSLLSQGSHVVIGRIAHKAKVLQTCKMQIHVLVQSCPLPKYLISHCTNENKTCNFTCRDPKAELHGETSLTCGDDMKWSGRLPSCKAPSWCVPPSPPEHGNISCKGATTSDGTGLNEGSTCRVKCMKGFRWKSRAVAVCRRGTWTHTLTCQPRTA